MSHSLSNFSKLAITPNMEAPSRGTVSATLEGKGKGRAPPSEDGSSSSDDSSSDGGDSDDQDDPNNPADDPEDLEDDDREESTSIPDNRSLFALDHCRQHDSTYAFQIAYAKVKNYSLRIERGNSIRCSCQEEDCRHRHWLLDQLSRVSNGRVTGPAGPSEVDPYTRILARGFENVCSELNWELRGPSVDVETEWQLQKRISSPFERHQQTTRMLTDRMNILRDIMTTSAPVHTINDHRTNTLQNPETINPRSVLVPGDIEATLFRLLVLDEHIFHQFQLRIPSNVQTSDYFLQMKRKAQETWELLEEYSADGPVYGHHYDVIWCGQMLVNIVEAIHKHIRDRTPLPPASRENAAHALVSILQLVVDKNFEMYSNNANWTRRRPLHEPARARNLYLRLIGEVSSDNPAGGTFVLRALEDVSDTRRSVAQLEAISRKVAQIAWSAPEPYRKRLSQIIARMRGGAGAGADFGPGPGPPPGPGPDSGPSSKRPAVPGPSNRNVKRMK
ncbi:hypothetical protein LOCC1_G001172 [Lachnellula occidentalis]|uniref:SWIM-type domain-containing protein n=1 Tax=Lachnellula occidentalis TaxID=215460 RepID=A0A8H8SB34_9HELO|nr:hypothetical protein LOCC1_G001172 [Lachnellula occidentalis]